MLEKRNLFRYIVYGLGGFITAGLFLLFKFQNKLIYVPVIPGIKKKSSENQKGYRTPMDRGINYENVEIKTEDNIYLRGWFIKQKGKIKGIPTVVYFHENAGNLGSRMDYIDYYYNKVNCNIFLMAYRGYDESEGFPSENGLKKDVQAIIKHVIERSDIDPELIYTHGRSLGGATSIYAISSISNQNQAKIAGMIIENTFTSLPELVSYMFPGLGQLVKLLLRNKWESIKSIENIRNRMLFIISLKDEVIPYKMMETLSESAKKATKKEKFIIENGDHNNNWYYCKNEYFNVIKSFLIKPNL